MSRHQYYYKPKATRPGNKPTETTRRRIHDQIVEVSNQEVVEQIKKTKDDPDTDYGYR